MFSWDESDAVFSQRSLVELLNSDVFTGQGLSGDVAHTYQKVLKGTATLTAGEADILAQAMLVRFLSQAYEQIEAYSLW